MCGAECSSPENWRLVEVEFKGLVVPRFRFLPASAQVKYTQGCYAVVGSALTTGRGPAQQNSALFSRTDLLGSAMEGD